MAGLILVRIVSTIVLAMAQAVNPLSGHFAVHRLSPEQLGKAKTALRDGPVDPVAVLDSQSFDVGDNNWILTYFSPAPGGKYKRGEIGLVVLHDQKFLGVFHTDTYTRPLGVDAVSFLDANADGLKDVVVIYRSTSVPGREDVDPIFFLGQKDTTYRVNFEFAVVLEQLVGKRPQTIKEVRSAVKVFARQAAEPPSPTAPPTHSYKLMGDLDDAKLTCVGKAIIDRDDEGKLRCMSWILEDVTCRGKADADWLNRDSDYGRICLRRGRWNYDGEIDGQGECSVSAIGGPLSADIAPEKTAFKINCIWTCRGSGPDSCSGGATYTFTPLAASQTKTPRPSAAKP